MLRVLLNDFKRVQDDSVSRDPKTTQKYREDEYNETYYLYKNRKQISFHAHAVKFLHFREK